MTYRNFSPEMLNAGRTRRQIAPQQQVNDDYDRAARGHGVNNASHGVGNLTRELESIANELGRLKTQQTQSSRSLQFQNLAQNSAAAAPSFDAAQLNSIVQSLKNDVRTQMRDDLDAQYVRLREELDGLNAAIAGTSLQHSFKGEISELISGLETLASGNRSILHSQDKLSNYLHREMGELQSSLNGLARNEGLTKLDDRWNSLEKRWNRLEDRIDGGLNTDSSAHLKDIQSRIAAIHDKMGDDGLKSVENRLLMLAKSVDALAHTKNSVPNTDFSQIDERFNELSRAVAAIGLERAAPAFDTQTIDQMEKAMSLLGRKLELVGSMSGQNPSLDAIEARLNLLNDRFSELPDYFNQEPIMERIDRLAERVSALPAPSISPASIDALTKQLNTLALEIRSGNGSQPIADGMFDRLDNRLGSIETRIQNLSFAEPGSANHDSDAVIAALERRFSDLSQQLEAMQASPVEPTVNDAGLHANLNTGLGALERKLGDISRQLMQNTGTATGSESFERLENQIADLSLMLARQPRDNGNELSQELGQELGHEIAARFHSLENMLSENQHAVLEVARKAAEEAASRFQGMSQNAGQSKGENTGIEADNSHIIGVIAGELATLEQLTRHSNDRSASAIEGIHGALTKIADRLGALEAKPASMPANAAPYVQSQAPAALPRMPVANQFSQEVFSAPSLDTAEGDFASLGLDDEHGVRKVRSPAEMAQQAASAALRNLDPQSAAAAAALNTMPGGDLDDVPLSPGANVPDLNSILKRVRDQKKASQSQVAKDVDRKDHFLSIKRAAQAAANEVKQVEPTINAGGRLENLKAIYAKFRRPILMVAAAAVVAIAAIQLTSALISSDTESNADLTTQVQEPAQIDSVPAANPQSPNTQAAALEPTLQGNSSAPGDAVTAQNDGIENATTQVESSPRIVGVEPNASDAIENTSNANTGTEVKLEGAASETAVAAAAPAIPEGFGPQPLIEAVKTNDAKAQFEMGRRLAESQDDAAAQTMAFGWFNSAAAQGFAPAQYRVGNMYEKGLGVERNATEAKLWYQMAAESGNASAMHNLAVLFASGADGTVDSVSALRWFQKAADLGVGDSQFNLGVMKGKGQGVPQDLEESYKWLAILAKSGDTEAAAKRDEVAKTMRPEQIEAAKAKVELWKPQPVVAEANDLAIPDSWKIASGTTASVDVKKAVKNVQLILTKLGYNVGTPDGVMGENTRKAIRAFQKKEQLAVSGEIDGPTVKALLAKNG